MCLTHPLTNYPRPLDQQGQHDCLTGSWAGQMHKLIFGWIRRTWQCYRTFSVKNGGMWCLSWDPGGSVLAWKEAPYNGGLQSVWKTLFHDPVHPPQSHWVCGGHPPQGLLSSTPRNTKWPYPRGLQSQRDTELSRKSSENHRRLPCSNQATNWSWWSVPQETEKCSHPSSWRLFVTIRAVSLTHGPAWVSPRCKRALPEPTLLAFTPLSSRAL